MSRSRKKKIGDLLTSIFGFELSEDYFSVGCGDPDEEWKLVKKGFHKNCLKTHPDKGGDAAEFRNIRTAFEVLREMYEKNQISSFSSSATKTADAPRYEEVSEEFKDMPTPCWEFYAAASEEAVPTYRAELAKSGRSNCKQTGKAKKCMNTNISMNELRLGSLDLESGSYTRWNHLSCFRVPNKIWKGLTNPDDANQVDRDLRSMSHVVLSGFAQLPPDARHSLVQHVMNKENWARERKSKAKIESQPSVEEKEQDPSSPAKFETHMVAAPQTNKYQMPIPGIDGAQPNILAGKTIVITGTFPELGGGAGLNLGKDKAKALCERFGARVTGSVSGKTNILLVGKEPGFSKVSQARTRGITLTSLDELTNIIKGQKQLEDVPPLLVKDFSAGYGGNSLAFIAPENELRLAQGIVQPIMPQGGASLPKPVKHPPRNNFIDDDDDDEPVAPPPKKKKASSTAKNTPQDEEPPKKESQNYC
mmetsp:Transcript_20086/g.24860  ORF Transcript_20086/g.24860 Transcript_20086/m.24860 type:complete len:477 (+) Transcript_20086:73-1503(+)